MFELNAFVHEVCDRLLKASKLAETNWMDGGKSYFSTIVRARFGTGRKDFSALLRSEGVSKDNTTPFNVMNCIRNLAQEIGYEDTEERYALLCDYVHHNLASSTTTNAGTREGQFAMNSYGGGMAMAGLGAILRYEYPVPNKCEIAIDETAPGFHKDALACSQWVNSAPQQPFSTSLIERYTGSALGLQRLASSTLPSRGPRVGRNEPCACGSGLKYKRCCGLV